MTYVYYLPDLIDIPHFQQKLLKCLPTHRQILHLYENTVLLPLDFESAKCLLTSAPELCHLDRLLIYGKFLILLQKKLLVHNFL